MSGAVTVHVSRTQEDGDSPSEDEVGLERHHPAHPGGVFVLQHAVAGRDGVHIAEDEMRAGRSAPNYFEQGAQSAGALKLEREEEEGEEVEAVECDGRMEIRDEQFGGEDSLGKRRAIVDAPLADGEARQQGNVAVTAALCPNVLHPQPPGELDHDPLIVSLGERDRIRPLVGDDGVNGLQAACAAEIQVIRHDTQKHGEVDYPAMDWKMRRLIALCLFALLIYPGDRVTVGPVQAGNPAIRFAVIGDYGTAGQAELDVANLVKSWSPDFVITVGDNNYPDGAASTIDKNIGQYYHGFISPYTGIYGAGATTNRFFPSLGNHDWRTPDAQPYLDYFTLPGNERYYDFTWGPAHFFAVDSDSDEPDGIVYTSAQAIWLQNELAASIAPWKLVYMHHPPFSSGPHGPTEALQWPYQAWGASVVLAGHDHDYERILRDDFPYFVNGLGGTSLYDFNTIVSGSVVRYNANYGAMLVEANDISITFQFITRAGTVIDTFTLSRDLVFLPLLSR